METLVSKLIGLVSIKWALMYLTSQKEYMGSSWLRDEVVRKGL